MNDTLAYSIGPVANPAESVASSPSQAQPWFAISGPAQRQTSEMAARIAYLERKIAALEAGTILAD